MLLLNGRISERSFKQYQRIKGTVESILSGFSAVGVIREQDRERFRCLGVPVERLQVCGNMKYDLKYDLMPQDPQELQESGTNAAEQSEKITLDFLQFSRMKSFLSAAQPAQGKKDSFCLSILVCKKNTLEGSCGFLPLAI